MSKKKLSAISDPDSPRYTQGALFPADKTIGRFSPFPSIHYTTDEFLATLTAAREEGFCGLDLEFSPRTMKPTILGIASKAHSASVRWDNDLAERVVRTAIDCNMPLVGHAVIGADKPVIDKTLGLDTPLSIWEDTILLHFLNNSDLTKAPGKEEDEGALGLMNLWCAISLTTLLPCYKACRGKYCQANGPSPCPTHRVFDYNAIDAWGGLMVFYETKRGLEEKNIPWAFYRELVEFTALTETMQRVGMRVDMSLIEELETAFKTSKNTLFPHELRGKERVFKDFNPASPDQARAWFRERGITLDGGTKKHVEKALAVEAKKYGIARENIKALITAIETHPGSLPETFDALFRWYQFKSAGKGTKAWFDSKFLHDS